MKLYATIHAEKLENGKIITVKKAQGSNTWLHVKLTVENVWEFNLSLCHCDRIANSATHDSENESGYMVCDNSGEVLAMISDKEIAERLQAFPCNGDDISCPMHKKHDHLKGKQQKDEACIYDHDHSKGGCISHN